MLFCSWRDLLMSFLKRWLSPQAKSDQATTAGDQNFHDAPLRRRNFNNLLSAEAEDAAPAPEASNVKQAQKARMKPSVAGKQSVVMKATTETKAVTESISVVLRRQVPIRFDEEAHSWLGGLPKMPVGTEWPRAIPKKPLHFIAQIDCASLPPELWGGLGPREGWLLLFADMEAITDQEKRPFVRVVHVAELGPEAEPPKGLYFALRDVGNFNDLPKAKQRQHFRKWPIDLVTVAPDTSALSGRELYGAPENDLILSASGGFEMDHPLTWRAAYMLLGALVRRHSKGGSDEDWRRNFGGLLDYPETDQNDYNKDWGERRKRIAEQLPGGYHCPEFTAAQTRLEAEMREERRNGWTQRAIKVIDEELARCSAKVAEHSTKASQARIREDSKEAEKSERWIESYKEDIAKHRENRLYLKDLFAQFPCEEAFVAEINRVGRVHKEWVLGCQNQLRVLLDYAGTKDLCAPIAASDWNEIAEQIASLKGVYWNKTNGTDVLRKVETGINYSLDNFVRADILDSYVSPATSPIKLGPDLIANLEPRMRNLETDRPHKLGGLVDSVYDDPLKKDHILLFQLASDAAVGWIFGDLGLIYVSIHPSELEAGSFDNVKAWLEA